MRSAGPRRSVSRCRLRRTSGSLSSLAIEPDTSTRKTRLRPRTASRSRLARRDVRGPHADEGQQVILVPRAGADLGRDRDRRVAGRRRVVEAEVVDELLDADRALGRQASFAQHPPDVGVGRGVDVGRERRARMRADAMEAGLRQVTVGLAIEAGDRLSTSARAAAGTSATSTPGRVGAPLDTLTVSARAATSSTTAIVVVRPETTVTVVCSALNPWSSIRDLIGARLQREHVEDALLVGDDLHVRRSRRPRPSPWRPAGLRPAESVTVPDNAAASCAANGLATHRPTHTSRTTTALAVVTRAPIAASLSEPAHRRDAMPRHRARAVPAGETRGRAANRRRAAGRGPAPSPAWIGVVGYCWIAAAL